MCLAVKVDFHFQKFTAHRPLISKKDLGYIREEKGQLELTVFVGDILCYQAQKQMLLL